MKKIFYPKFLLLGIFSLMLAAPIFAQFSIGGRTGINIGSFRWSQSIKDNDAYTTKSVVVPHVSFVSHYAISDVFGIQAELGYIKKGATLNYYCKPCNIPNANGQVTQIPEGESDSKYVSDYFELPVLAKFTLGSESFAFNIFAGPALSMALAGKMIYREEITQNVQQPNNQQQTTQTQTSTNTSKLKYGKDFKRMDIGIMAGAGLMFGAGPGSITFDLRYNLGLTGLEQKADVGEKIQNRAFQIGVGYIVPIG